MTKYSSLHSPPAPVASISVRNPTTLELIHDVPMLLDSGADITLIPRSVCEQLGIETTLNSTLQIASYDGKISETECVFLDLYFLGKRFRGKFVVYDNSEGIIGRNILNKFSIRLDGPNLKWTN